MAHTASFLPLRSLLGLSVGTRATLARTVEHGAFTALVFCGRSVPLKLFQRLALRSGQIVKRMQGSSRWVRLKLRFILSGGMLSYPLRFISIDTDM